MAASRAAAAPASELDSRPAGCAAGLKPAALERLAAADAFRSLGLDRRAALWAVRALRRAGDKDDLPLFAHFVARRRLEPDVDLLPMRLGEQVVEDYRRLHLSLKAHPVAFLRDELQRRSILRHDELAAAKSGRRVTVAGLVLVRQRPRQRQRGDLHDAGGRKGGRQHDRLAAELYRDASVPIVIGARLVKVTGKLQNEFGRDPCDRRAASTISSPLLERACRAHRLRPGARQKR